MKLKNIGLILSLLAVSTFSFADTAIWSLTDGTTANATDRIPIARSAIANNYITPLEIATYVGTTYGTNVATMLGIAIGTTGGPMKQNGAITSGNLLKGDGSGGVQDTGVAASALKPVLLSQQQALGTSAIASGACATVITIAATNVATTSTVHATFSVTPVGVTGYDPSVTTGSLQVFGYPTTGNVNIGVCNPTASSITPAAMTVNVVAY